MSEPIEKTFSNLSKIVAKWSSLSSDERIARTLKLANTDEGVEIARAIVDVNKDLCGEASDDESKKVKQAVVEIVKKRQTNASQQQQQQPSDGAANNGAQGGAQEGAEEGGGAAAAQGANSQPARLSADEMEKVALILKSMATNAEISSHAERSVSDLWQQCQEMATNQSWLDYEQHDFAQIETTAASLVGAANDTQIDKKHEKMLALYCQLVLATLLNSIKSGNFIF